MGETNSTDSIVERKRAIIEASKQLGTKLSGFFGKVHFHYEKGVCVHAEIHEGVKPSSEQLKGKS